MTSAFSKVFFEEAKPCFVMVFSSIFFAIAEVGTATPFTRTGIDPLTVVAGTAVMIAAAKAIVGIDAVFIIRLMHKDARADEIACLGIEVVVFAAI